MVEKEMSTYKLAKYTYWEIFTDSQLQSAGSHQTKALEKYRKNNKYVKSSSFAVKIVFAFLLSFLPILPLIYSFEIQETLENTQILPGTVLFLSSLLFGLYIVMSFTYILLFGLFTTSSLTSGNAFKWVQCLPISKEKMRKLGVMTIFRSFDIPLIAMTAALPIIMFIGTQNILILLMCIVTSFLNVVFSFSVLVILGERLSRILYGTSISSKKASIMRIATMAGYVITMISMTIILSSTVSNIDNFLVIFATNESLSLWNLILSFIPYPFGMTYLISWVFIPVQMPIELLTTTLIGFGLFILVTWRTYRKALRTLHSVTSSEVKGLKLKEPAKVPIEEIEVEIKPITPIKSYLKKDLISSTRDFKSFMLILMPILWPALMIASMTAPISNEVSSSFGIIILWAIILAMVVFIPIILVIGLLNIEESGASIVASLPLIPRNQAKAKIILISTIQSISFVVISIVVTFQISSPLFMIVFLATLPFGWIFLLSMFEMKICLFGKMKYKYVLEEVYKRHKVRKWVAIILSEIGLYFLIVILGFALFNVLELIGTALILLIIGILGLLVVIYIFTKMFPKEKKMSTYVSGGALRENPILGGVILSISYVGFLYISSFAQLPVLLPFESILSYTAILFFDFLFQFGFLALLWFLVVPKGMKLPTFSKSFKDYAENIHLSTVRPLKRNILLGIGSFLIFGTIILLGAIFLGNYTFDPSILLGNPDPNKVRLAAFGWFLFVYMLIPGIWEEVAHRGVIMPMLQKKYSQKSAIIINGLLFGLMHGFNIINWLILGIPPISVLYQMIYATFFGWAFAYMYAKTDSLLPGIILHYLIDSVGQILLNTQITNVFVASIYLIGFIGIIPSILVVIFVQFVMDREQARNKEIN